MSHTVYTSVHNLGIMTTIYLCIETVFGYLNRKTVTEISQHLSFLPTETGEQCFNKGACWGRTSEAALYKLENHVLQLTERWLQCGGCLNNLA